MEQSPFSGYVKAAMFGILAFAVFTAVWQRSKLEDKVVALDRSVAALDQDMREERDEARRLRSSIDELRGVNETLVALIAQGGVRAPSGGTGEGVKPPSIDIGRRTKRDWGWELNPELDQDLDPSRPLGTPGRYKNFLTLDPAGHQSQDDVPDRNGVLNLPFGSEPKGFNALLENSADLSDYVELYMYDSVGNRHWKRPSAFNQAPALCWRVEVSPDFKEYTLFFRKDAFWHEPPLDTRNYPHLAGKHPVTAHDLKFTVDIIKDPQSDCANLRSYYNECDGVEVIDDYTAVMRWKDTLFTSLSWTFNGYIIPRFVYAYDEEGNEYPKETVAQAFNDHWYDLKRVGPVGNSAYRFTRYEPNKYLHMERWDDWYGFEDTPPYPIRERHLRIYRESETAMNWGRAGELDIFGLNATRYRDWVLEETNPRSPFKNGDIVVYKAPHTAYLYFGWKNTDPLFEDKRVRLALTYACNRQEICEKIFLGLYEPMASPVYPASEEADPDLKPLPFDLDKARQLLEEAGWKVNPDTGLREKVVDGRKLSFEFKLNWPGPSPDFENALNHYKNDLIKIGIKMEPLSSEWAGYQKDLHDRKFNAFSLLWVVPGWEHDFVQIWHSRGIQDPGSSNYIEYSNPEVDRLSDELRTLMDPKKRAEYVRRIGRILYEEAPYTFFGWRRVFRGYHKYVKGVQEYPYYTRPLMRTLPFWIER